MYAKANDDFKARRLRAVKEDLNSSAAVLARKALEDLMDYAQSCQIESSVGLELELKDLALQLVDARPSRLVVANLLQHWLQSLPELPTDLERARGRAAVHAEEVIAQLEEAQGQAVAKCLAEIQPGMTLMTHSCSSNVISLFRACHLANLQVQAIVTESRPGMEGRKLARYLNKLGMPCQFITEAQMASFVVQADKVIIGADSVLRDGSLISKAGSRLLALAAKDAGIPFWVVAESFKHSSLLPEDAVLEEADISELQLEAMPHIEVHNIYFDLIPARLVTAWADEHQLAVTFRSLAANLANNLPQVQP